MVFEARRGGLLAAGFLSAALAVTPLVAGGTAEEADRLAGPAPGGVTGKVMDSRGEPLPGVRVTLRKGETTRTLETDPEGIYCFCRVPPARDYRLLFEREGYATVMQNDLNVSGRKLSVMNLILRRQEEFSSPVKKGEGSD